MDSFKPTLLHMVELVIVLAILWVINYFFEVDSASLNGVLLVVLAGLAKFARASDSIPLKDFVNDPKK